MPTPDATQYSGTSTPPNGGQVTDTGTDASIDTPGSNDSTVAQTAAPSTPPPVQPASPNAAQTPQPNQNPGNPQGPGAPPPTIAQTQQAKAQVQTTGVQAQKSPAVAKASVFHDIAETLSGGPRYNYTVDAAGNMQRTKVPVSNAHLALAIAMEAIGGGLAGLGAGPGPQGTAKAGIAGYNQQLQQSQQQDQQQRAQAQQDFARKAQVTETNMRMYQNAQAVGREDAEATDKYIAQYAPIAEKMQSQLQGYVHEAVGYAGLKKYNATAQTAIPYKRVPRVDNNGEQVKDARGIPQWDIDYLVLDPGFKTSGLITPDGQKTLSDWGIPGTDNPNLQDTPMNATLALNRMSLASNLQIADGMFSNIFSTLDKANDKGTPVPPDLNKAGTLEAPNVQNANLVDGAADKYAAQVKGVIAPDNFKALLRGLVAQESGGNQDAVSPTGAIGIMQLTKGTASQLGVDRNNPAQNVDGGTKYFTQLLNQFKDPKKALAAYYSGPGAIGPDGKIQDTADHSAAETQKYVDQVSKRVNLQDATPATGEQSEKYPDPKQFAKDHPTFPAAVQSFVSAMNAQKGDDEGKVGNALATMAHNGQQDQANLISAFLKQGGDDAVTKHDAYLTQEVAERKADVATKAQENRAEFKSQLDEKASAITQSYLKAPDNFQLDPNISGLDATSASKSLAAQGVKIPTNFDALWQVAHYKAPYSILPARTWQKGAPNEMDTQTGLSYIGQFLNPGFDTKNFQTAQKIRLENASGNSKNGAAIQNAGVAAQHLSLLEQAGDALDNGSIPQLNSLANRLGAELGSSPLITYNNIVQIATQEVEKVAAGGTVPYKESIQQAQQNLAQGQSPQQRKAAVQALTGLMYGRIKAIDENTYDNTQDHLNNVPSEATARFRQYGLDTPWDFKSGTNSKTPNQNQNQQLLPGQRQGEIPKYLNGKLVGFTMPGKTGMRPATPQQ